jgi:protein required for attachment to host cells
MRRYIVIADASVARIYDVPGPNVSPSLLKEMKHPKGRARPQEIDSDQPGRRQKGMGLQPRSAMDPRTDSHTHEVRRFASEVGAVIQAANDEGAFDELAIVAPPKFLGLLRKELGGAKSRLRAAAARNCTRMPAAELATELNALLPGWFKVRRSRVARVVAH